MDQRNGYWTWMEIFLLVTAAEDVSEKLRPTVGSRSWQDYVANSDFHPVYIQGDIVKAELMAPQDIAINNKGEIIFSGRQVKP